LDLHFTNAESTPEERAAVDEFLGPALVRDAHVARGGHAAREQRHMLLPALHALSRRIGWISEGGLNHLCRRLDVPPADAFGVASFYGLFSTKPRPKKTLHVCDDIVCALGAGARLCADLERSAGPSGEEVRNEGWTWQRSPCLGLCEHGSAALLTVAGAQALEHQIAPATLENVTEALAGESPELKLRHYKTPASGGESRRLLRRVGRVNPESLDAYLEAGGYAALRRALEIGASGVVREVIDSKLMGRGGAAFPTGRKWEAVAKESARPHLLVCNADESEPGTFKDRILMEEDPFAIVEAMTIAAFAGSCEKGYVYVRGEYPLALARMTNAIEIAREKGLLGDNILQRGFAFDIEVRRGAGAYICGEETALFNSIEGYRGEPRNKPPFPVQRGLFGKPTIVNNVETLVNVLDIVLEGGEAFRKTGTAESTGTKLFCVSGDVVKPGLHEVPFGMTLRALIDRAGGVRGKAVQAVLLGGAAGTFMAPGELDTPLSFEGARAASATLGSGVVIVFNESADLKAAVLRIAKFFREESCGQCVPCRVGTVRQEELLHRLAGETPTFARGAPSELELLAEIGQVMRDASICGLGQTASSAIESALAKFAVFGGAVKA
jgi:NADH-quinone oxidoreductase subunit F